MLKMKARSVVEQEYKELPDNILFKKRRDIADEVVTHIVIENRKLVKAETYTDIPYKQPLLKRPITIEMEI